MGKNKRFNISIIIISSVAVFLQTLNVSLEEWDDSKAAQFIIILLNSALITLQSLQINLKRLKKQEKEAKMKLTQAKDSGDEISEMNLPPIHIIRVNK